MFPTETDFIAGAVRDAARTDRQLAAADALSAQADTLFERLVDAYHVAARTPECVSDLLIYSAARLERLSLLAGVRANRRRAWIGAEPYSLGN